MQLDVGYYTAFAVPKGKGRRYEFVAISDAVSDRCSSSCIHWGAKKLHLLLLLVKKLPNISHRIVVMHILVI